MVKMTLLRFLLLFFILLVIAESGLNEYVTYLYWDDFEELRSKAHVKFILPKQFEDSRVQNTVSKEQISRLQESIQGAFHKKITFSSPCSKASNLETECFCDFLDYKSKKNLFPIKSHCFSHRSESDFTVFVFVTEYEPIQKTLSKDIFYKQIKDVYVIMTSDKTFYSHLHLLTNISQPYRNDFLYVFPLSFGIENAVYEAIKMKASSISNEVFLQKALDIMKPSWTKKDESPFNLKVNIKIASPVEVSLIERLTGALSYRYNCMFGLSHGKRTRTCSSSFSGLGTTNTRCVAEFFETELITPTQKEWDLFSQAKEESPSWNTLHIRLILGNFMHFIKNKNLTDYLTSLKAKCCGPNTYYIWVLPETEKINNKEFYQTVSGVIVRVPSLDSPDTIFKVVEELDTQFYAFDADANYDKLGRFTDRALPASTEKSDLFFVLPKAWNTNMYFFASYIVENNFYALTKTYINNTDIAFGLGTVGSSGVCDTHLQPTTKSEIFKYNSVNSTFIKEDISELSLSYFECLDFFMTEENIKWRQNSQKIFVIFADSLPSLKRSSDEAISAINLYAKILEKRYKILLLTISSSYRESWKSYLLTTKIQELIDIEILVSDF